MLTFVAPNQRHIDIFSSENLDLCQVVCCLSVILLTAYLDGRLSRHHHYRVQTDNLPFLATQVFVLKRSQSTGT